MGFLKVSLRSVWRPIDSVHYLHPTSLEHNRWEIELQLELLDNRRRHRPCYLQAFAKVFFHQENSLQLWKIPGHQ